MAKAVRQLLIPAAYGRAVLLKKGQALKVITVHGKQVCDFFAFNPQKPSEFLSPCHTRSANRHLSIIVGKPLYNNSNEPVLMLEEDTAGIHDMRCAACDPVRYGMYGAWQHRSCKMNLLEELEKMGISPPVIPEPVNLFMNVPVAHGDSATIQPPTTRAGDYVVMRALQDLIVVGSACPMDLNPTNNFKPTDILFEIYNTR